VALDRVRVRQLQLTIGRQQKTAASCVAATAFDSYSLWQLQCLSSSAFGSIWQHLRSTATACDRHGVRLLRQLQCSTTAARGSYSISSTFDWQFQLVAATAFDSHSTWPLQCSIAVTLDSRPYSHLAATAFESHTAIAFDSCGTRQSPRSTATAHDR
jgi:hypothetical protein